MENSELKKQNWKKAKTKFLEKVPKRFKIRVDGLDDNTEYCHPIIELDDVLIIRGQMDTNCTYVYGLYLQVRKEIIVGHFIYTLSLPIDLDVHLEYLMSNYEKIKQSLMEGFSEIERIHHLRHDLETVQNNIVYNAIAKEVDKSKLKDSIEKIYSVTEYLENKRLNM